MEIEDALINFQKLINDAILKDGAKGKEAIIRSSKPIQNIHEAVKSKLIQSGIESVRIYPPLENTSPELTLAGFLKNKAQDVCVIPKDTPRRSETLTDGLLQGNLDTFGQNYTERTLTINVRSQVSSLAKNFDTLYERNIAEAQNLHIRCKKMCLGEVYMIAVPEYSSDAVNINTIKFLNRVGTVEKYIKSFQAINNRIDTTKEEYKYERICLLIVDFQQNPIKLYNSDEELKAAGLLKSNSTASITELTWSSFIPSLLQTYNTRFGS